MKIAKILSGSPDNKKGLFNNVMERTKHLMEVEPNVDCYIIRLEYGLALRLLKRQFKKATREEYTTIDGIKFKNLWITLGLLDYLLTHKLHRRVVIGIKQLNKYVDLFEKYDLLSSHGIDANFFSAQVKIKNRVPFVTTWHGSDINIAPFHNKLMENEIKKLLDTANHNFFVSQKLLEISYKISDEAKTSVLYTGPAKSFTRYSSAQRQALRQKYDLKTTYVIGFVGNLLPVKNVLTLPLIFKKLQDEIRNISFLIVGDGVLSSQLSNEFTKQGIKNLHMFGKQDPEKIPDIMNCLNVLVLPSLNEGMPRVTLEAQACGIHVVGSNRGGIPEAIGDKNCFALDFEFIDNISSRILQLLKTEAENERPVLSERFSWAEAVEKELSIYKRILL